MGTRRSEDGLSWSEQWGPYNNTSDDAPFGKANGTTGGSGGGSGGKKNKKMQDVKAAASVGLGKAKVAASAGAETAKVVASVGAEKAKVGALKLKTGTVTGFKWIKEQCTKKK